MGRGKDQYSSRDFAPTTCSALEIESPFPTGLSGGSPRTATGPVWPYTSATTPLTNIETGASASCLLDRERRSSSEHSTAMHSLFGESSSTTAASKASTAPSSGTRGRRSRLSLSDRLTLSLITSGLVRGITPTSVRRVSGLPIPDIVFWPRAGSGAGARRAACTSSNAPESGTGPDAVPGMTPDPSSPLKAREP